MRRLTKIETSEMLKATVELQLCGL